MTSDREAGIRCRGPSNRNPWIHCYRPRPEARVRLYCFPYAGGSAQSFRSWPAQLPATIEVCAVQPPGRWDRLKEPPFKRMGLLVQAASRALLRSLERPYALFGHSLGALVAFELARQVRAQAGVSPSHLFLSSARAPQLFHGRREPLLHTLPEQEFIDALIVRYQHGIPEMVLKEPTLLQALLPYLRADIELYETYEHVSQPPLPCPISVFCGADDPDATKEEMEAWQEHTSAAFSLEMFAGGHFFWHRDEQPLLGVVSRELADL